MLIYVQKVGDVPVPLPSYKTKGAAGADLMAAIENPVTLCPGERRLFPSGLVMSIPPGYEIQIRPRSGLALKHGVTVLNTPGTVDSDYRGEIKVLLVNLGQEEFTVYPGNRIAQIVVAPVTRATFGVVRDLDSSDRGEGGFGSTGV
jgi:dUTP pyrophosphatase